MTSTDVRAQVCLQTLTPDAVNGRTRISWDLCSAKTSTGAVVRPVAGDNGVTPFPRESRVSPMECVEGILRFPAAELVSVIYKNGQGERGVFVPGG